MKSLSTRILLRIGRFLLLLYVGLVIAGCCISDRLVFPVPERVSCKADAPGLVRIPLATGADVPALWLESPGAKRTLIYFHGNAMDIEDSRDFARLLQKRGQSVLVVEYPGYGIAAGKPSEEGCYAAADAALNWLQTQKAIPTSRIILYGYSLGTGVATDLASRHPEIGALILEAPFLSTFRVVTRIKILPLDRFDSLAKIDRVRCPLLILHGTDDRVVPFWHGEKLFDAAVEVSYKKFLRVEGGGHIDLQRVGGLPFWGAIEDILQIESDLFWH
jgi:fermentation-respiration switch protein FrsA (DUF1100 family)